MNQGSPVDGAVVVLAACGAACILALFGWMFMQRFWRAERVRYYEALAQEHGHLSAAEFRERYTALKRRMLRGLILFTCLLGAAGLAIAATVAAAWRQFGGTQYPRGALVVWVLIWLAYVVPLFGGWFFNERAALLHLYLTDLPVGDQF